MHGAWQSHTSFDPHEEQPPPPPAANALPAARNRYEDKRDQYNARYDLAAAIIFQSCSTTIQAYIAGNSEPQAMWQTLKNRVDNAFYENGPKLLRDCHQKVRYNGDGNITTFIL